MCVRAHVCVYTHVHALVCQWVSQIVRMVCVFVYICTKVGKCRVRVFIRVCMAFFFLAVFDASERCVAD